VLDDLLVVDLLVGEHEEVDPASMASAMASSGP
jgi:hypothetical protein